MTNREKFAEQILDIACNGDSVAIDIDGKPVICRPDFCSKCAFLVTLSCSKDILHWANSEYIEKPKISESDLRFLDYLPERYKYMARDRNGFLNAYDLKVEKTDRSWTSARYITMDMTAFNISFPMIKWEDEEPWLIEDLKKLEVEV